MQLLLEKIAKNHYFGDFWWFSCFWHDVTYDVTVASYKVCLYFFWYQWTREGHSYPLVPHTWCFVNRFPRSWGAESPPPPGCEMGPKSPTLLGLTKVSTKIIQWLAKIHFTYKQSKIHKNTQDMPQNEISCIQIVKLISADWHRVLFTWYRVFFYFYFFPNFERAGIRRYYLDNRDFAFFCVWTNETSASRNLRSYLVLQRLCNEAALSPGIDAFLY